MTLTAVAAEAAGASSFNTAMDHVAQGFEALGTLILVVGVLWSFILAWLAWHRSGQLARAYAALREAFGGTLLLGLEILVAADLIRTVAVAPTLTNVLVLGLIVLIRTFLSFPGDGDRGCPAVAACDVNRSGHRYPRDKQGARRRPILTAVDRGWQSAGPALTSAAVPPR